MAWKPLKEPLKHDYLVAGPTMDYAGAAKFALYGVWPKTKDGKRRKDRCEEICGGPYTELRKCESCGLLKGPRFIQHRSGLTFWHDDPPGRRGMLCMPCYNRERPIDTAKVEIEQTRRTINKLKRIISDERKKEKRGLDAALQHSDDGAAPRFPV